MFSFNMGLVIWAYPTTESDKWGMLAIEVADFTELMLISLGAKFYSRRSEPKLENLWLHIFMKNLI